MGSCAEAFDQVDCAVELFAGFVAEEGRGVRDAEEDDGEGLHEEVVVADLLGAVDVGDAVDADDGGDGVFCDGDDGFGLGAVFGDGGGAVEDGAVDGDAGLVLAEEHEEAEAAGFAVGQVVFRGEIGAVELEVGRELGVPLHDLEVEVADLVAADTTRGTRVEGGDVLPDLGGDVVVGCDVFEVRVCVVWFREHGVDVGVLEGEGHAGAEGPAAVESVDDPEDSDGVREFCLVGEGAHEAVPTVKSHLYTLAACNADEAPCLGFFVFLEMESCGHDDQDDGLETERTDDDQVDGFLGGVVEFLAEIVLAMTLDDQGTAKDYFELGGQIIVQSVLAWQSGLSKAGAQSGADEGVQGMNVGDQLVHVEDGVHDVALLVVDAEQA